jgi:Protein of unknown function (DUF2796)
VSVGACEEIIMYRSVQLLAALGVACSGTISGSVHAAEFRSRPPHVHGLATVDIAVDGLALAITFRAPAINVIGFEHAPTTPDEKAAVAHANQTYKAGNKLFVTSAAAGCTQRAATLTPITYETDGEEKPNAPQADYEVAYQFACQHVDKLAWVDTTLFAAMRNAQRITVNVVADRLQTQVVLVPGQHRIALLPE